MELKRDEIIKAMECCYDNTLSCIDCPFQAPDKYMECSGLTLSALALIKELTEEKKKSDRVFSDLYKEAETYLAQRDCLRNLVKNLTEENERLRCEVSDLKDELKCEKETNTHLCSQYMSENHLRYQAEEMLANGMSVVKSDTVRKMQDRLDKRFCHDPAFLGVEQRLIMGVIDQIAKEMLEGENES